MTKSDQMSALKCGRVGCRCSLLICYTINVFNFFFNFFYLYIFFLDIKWKSKIKKYVGTWGKRGIKGIRKVR